MARVARCPICYTHISVGVHEEALGGCPVCGAYLQKVETVQAHLIPTEVKEVLSKISIEELKGVASSLKLSSVGSKETLITRLLLKEAKSYPSRTYRPEYPLHPQSTGAAYR